MTVSDYSDRPPGSPPPRSDGGMGVMKPLLIGCGILGFLGLVALTVFGVAMSTGYLPDSSVMRGSKMSDRLKGQLEEHVLRPGESILLFATVDFVSVYGDGQLLTDQRVVSWETDVRETPPDEIDLGAIRMIEAEFDEGLMGFSYVTLIGDFDESGLAPEFTFLLPSERKGDVHFVKGIVTEARRVQGNAVTLEVHGDISEEDTRMLYDAGGYRRTVDEDD